eukprot:12274_2
MERETRLLSIGQPPVLRNLVIQNAYSRETIPYIQRMAYWSSLTTLNSWDSAGPLDFPYHARKARLSEMDFILLIYG